jgi:radical SAM superfamily enzyme YgiQ (UPF0313 family)
MKHVKILLIIPRYNFTDIANYNYSFPLGLGYISSALKKAKYNIDCLNLNHTNGKINDILNAILNRNKYDFILTGNNALGYAIIETIINSVRKHHSKPKIILGGPIITSAPEIVFNALNPDFGVLGEGEETIIELLTFLEKEKDLAKVNGIIYKNNEGKIIRTPKRKPIENLDSIPFPDFEGFGFSKQIDNFDCNYVYHCNHFDHPRIFPLLASRSCPYQCTFCYHDSSYRRRSMKNIMKELNFMVKKYKINTILIYDECFAIDKKRLLDFCKRITKLKKEISWDLRWTCQLRVENVDADILKIMKESGCEAISYGFESFSPIVLKSMRKNITPEQIDKAFKETIKAKIYCQGFFIFGDTVETMKSAKTTLSYWEKNCAGQIGLGFIQPYPGSEIYKKCIKKGIIKDELDFIKNKISQMGTRGLWLNMTDKMEDKEIKWLRNKLLDSTGKYFKFVLPLSLKQENKDHYCVEVKCPFCKTITKYGNCLIKNKFSYGFLLICRDCHKHFFVVSSFQKLAYRFYPIARTLRDIQKNIQDLINKKRL